MSKENNLTDFLTDVANAIREKKGTTDKINPQDFSSEIESIVSGNGELQAKTIKIAPILAAQTIKPDKGYDGFSSLKVVGYTSIWNDIY